MYWAKKLVAAVLGLAGFSEANVAEQKAKDALWLEAKGKEEGVISLASGMKYKVLKKGEGKAHPLVSTSCLCHYEGTTTDGEVFDSSMQRGQPITFAPNQVIKGWTEAMQLMVEGDEWELYIPSDMAYGDRGAGGKIPGGATLVFKINLIEIKGKSRPVEEL